MTEKKDAPAKAADSAARGGGVTRKQVAIGAATGIGSAALVAALLYANRGMARKKNDGPRGGSDG